MAVGDGVVVRRADQPREERAFRRRQLAQVLAEVGFAGFGESPDAEAAAIAEVDLVRIHLKNALLAEALLQFEGEHRFGKLSPPGAIGRKKISTRDLHGDGAGALDEIMSMPDVGPCRADDADEVKAGVLEEALVFRGENGLYQLGRQIVVTYRTALFAKAVEEVGDQLRLDFRGAHV